MKNKDVIQATKNAILMEINQAVKDGNEEVFAQAFCKFSEHIQETVLAEAQGLIQAADTNILSSRGVRQLTSEEKNYYQKVIEAMRSSAPQQALSNLDVVMPVTTIDAIFEDLEESHELLSVIDFKNTSGLIEYLVNLNGNQLASWGTLTSTIVKELTSGFKKINLGLKKLSAFIPVAKSMLDLGPEWLDRYVRIVLSEAIFNGLEEGIINGTGKDMPIGMNRQVGDGVTVVDGVYPLKTATPIVSLDPETYGDLISGMAVAPNGKTRVVSSVIMVVNPVDHLQKVMPATTVRKIDGEYVNNVFPFPTRVIQSIHVPQNRAIFGLPSKYFAGVGTAKSGKIEASDEYRFLEDERVYLVKLYGHGEPLDNSAFVYADISGLLPAAQEVKVTNVVKTKEQED